MLLYCWRLSTFGGCRNGREGRHGGRDGSVARGGRLGIDGQLILFLLVARVRESTLSLGHLESMRESRVRLRCSRVASTGEVLVTRVQDRFGARLDM